MKHLLCIGNELLVYNFEFGYIFNEIAFESRKLYKISLLIK